MSWEISGFLFEGLTQTYFERGAYLSSFPSFLLRILGAKKKSSEEKIPPATAQSCSVIQSFQASKAFPLRDPLQQTQKKNMAGPLWSVVPTHSLNQQSTMILYRGWHVKMLSRGSHVSPRGQSPSTWVWALARHRKKPVAPKQPSHLAEKVCPDDSPSRPKFGSWKNVNFPLS